MNSKGLVLSVVVSLLMAGGLLVNTSLAQTTVTATISGVITDATGAVIPGVSIKVTNTGTQQVATATTNSAGYFVIPNLPSGNYDVEARKEGFQAWVEKGLHLDPAANVTANGTLQVGQVTQMVEVTASTVNVQTEDSKVARTVNSTQMEELPVNGRNFVSLLGLQPGVVQSFTFNSFQGMSGFGAFASQCTQVNGLTGESNNLLIDGAPSTRTRANGMTVAMPSMDAISEVNIITTGYMPEYSRAAGGQMVVTTKSGTDHYHGNVYEFVRNDALDSRYFFSPTVPALKINDFGYTFGGPVIPNKHKLYFFWSQEWQREINGNTEVGTVPTLADRAGNLNGYCQVFGTCPVVPTYLNGVDGLVAGQPFPNNTIPSDLISPNGQAMVSMFLKPNTDTQSNAAFAMEGGNNIIYNYNTPNFTRAENFKVDYNVNSKNHLAVTGRHIANTISSPAGSNGGSALLDQGYEFPSRAATMDWTTTFSPTLLNDFTATATEDIVHVLVPSGSFGGNGLDRSSLGVTYPYIIPGGDASKDIPGKIPTVIISGFEQISGLPYPSGSVGHIYTLQDVITKVHSNHTFKAGIWWEHDGENDHDQVRVTPGGGVGNNLNGQFEFNASNPYTTGSPLADALLGNFDNYSELGYRNYTPWAAHQIGFFGQDSWKVTPRLTIQGGVRWDYFQPYSSKWCNWAIFSPAFYSFAAGTQQVVDPNTGFITGGNPYNGIGVPCSSLPQSAAGHTAVFGERLTSSNLAGINQQLKATGMLRGLSPQIVDSHYGNIQPRLGFAWDPTGSGKSAIRAGAGIFYNHNTLSDVTLEGGNSPFQLAEEVFNSKADCPGSALDAQRNCQASSGAVPNLPIPMTGSDLVGKIPVVYSWNFSVQHEFFGNTLVDVGYVGNRARHMFINADLNQPAIGTFNNPANASINAAALRPFPGIGGAMTSLQEANSKYDALQLSVQRRFTNNLQYQVAYTYAKAFDMADSIYSVVTDTYNPKYNWQVAGFNQTHALILTWVYDEPWFKNSTSWAAKNLGGGWELSGDMALDSGFPKSVYASSDYLGNGTNSIGGNEYAYIQQGCHTRGNRSFLQFFNTSCFYEPNLWPNIGLTGAATGNIIEGPGTDNFDFALIKNGNILGEGKVQYQFRAEFFNAFNHPSFNGIDQTVTDSTFGQVNSAISPRNIQLGLKILF